MADFEQRLDTLEVKYHDIDKRQESFEEFTRSNIRELREITKELKETNRELKESNRRIDSKMDEISREVRSIGRYVNGLVITTIIGIAAMVWSMVSFLGSIKP